MTRITGSLQVTLSVVVLAFALLSSSCTLGRGVDTDGVSGQKLGSPDGTTADPVAFSPLDSLPTVMGPPLSIGASSASIVEISDFETKIYVSPEGNDSNFGTEDSPLRTFLGARNLARTLLDGDGHIGVFFHAGEYVFDETVVLGPRDGGTPRQIVTYAAYPGETPVFSSLVRLSGWEPYQGAIVRAKLPAEVNHVRFLWGAGSEWLPRSSTRPFFATELSVIEEGCLECNWDDSEAQSARSNVAYPDDLLAPDRAMASQYDLRQSTQAWLQETLPIDRVDTEDQRIYTQIPASLEMRLNFEEAENLNRNWVLNSLEGIDQPGEWASLDGFIYLYPETKDTDLRVPMLTELIRVDDGTVDGNQEIAAPVGFIHFDGLTFTGGDFRVMENDDITIQHDWSVVDAPTALLRLRNISNIEVRSSTFERSGGTGLRVDRFGQRISILGNTFSDLGREAVTLIGRGPGYGDVNMGNEISFNTIRRTGMEKWTAPAIVIEQSSNNRVHHNYISDTQFSAIVLSAPRQLAFVSRYEAASEGIVPGYAGREFHYWEIAPSVLQEMSLFEDELRASYEAMNSIYNYNNVVELNTLVDVGQGAGYLVNGYVYNSAVKRGERSFINYNYVRDNSDNLVNNPVFYSDSDQDGTTYIGNVVSGVRNGGGESEPIPIFLMFNMYAEGGFNGGSKIEAFGNIVADSDYPTLVEGINFEMVGSVTDDSSGASQALAIYRRLTRILQNNELPGVAILEGTDGVQDLLDSTIEEIND